MKTKSIKTLLVAAITLAAMSVPATANAQLGGLVKKARDAVLLRHLSLLIFIEK